MNINQIEIRVPYADTDQMGMVYYSNYLVYFERGRTEWLRDAGIKYKDLEEKGCFFPVMECLCKYSSPAKYDDIVTVKTVLGEIGAASVKFDYEILCGGKLLAAGYTRHPLVNRAMKPVRMPPDLRQKLEERNG
ncbi:MAG: thioesterase family protein [Elusimicrobiota bacterium]